MNQMNKIQTDNIQAALETAGIRSCYWPPQGATTRVYIQIRDLFAETDSQLAELTRTGAYCEMNGDEVLVRHLSGAPKETVIAALTAAGLTAR